MEGFGDSVPPSVLVVPKNTVVSIELVDAVGSAKSKPGDIFRARLSEGVWVQGKATIPPGTTVRGVVVQAQPSGRVSGRSHLELTLRSIDMDGKTYVVASDTLTYTGEAHWGQHIGSWLSGTLQGVLYGVLLGGKKGAIMGAGAGGAVGTAGSVLSGKSDVELSQGSKLMFETINSVEVPTPPVATSPTPPQVQTPPPAKETNKDAKPSS